MVILEILSLHREAKSKRRLSVNITSYSCLCTCVWTHIPKHKKNTSMWHCLELCRLFWPPILFIVLLFERKIGFGAVSVSEIALFDS